MICNLISYEKYIPVLSDEEQIGLLDHQPTLAQLQDWEQRLESRTSKMEERFKRSYSKTIKQKENGQR